MIGHWGLAARRSALSSNSDAGDGWKLLQAGVVEGVGWVVWHLRRDLHNRHKLSEEPAGPPSENPNAQRSSLKNTDAEAGWMACYITEDILSHKSFQVRHEGRQVVI